METYQPAPATTPTATGPTPPLKESIRDMIRLQQDYHLPDELFWEIFNNRVLLNLNIDVNALIHALNVPSARA